MRSHLLHLLRNKNGEMQGVQQKIKWNNEQRIIKTDQTESKLRITAS